MKISKNENKKLSDIIDQLTDGLDSLVEIYNDSEEDVPLIAFKPNVVESIEKAKKVYGAKHVDDKINKIVQETLSWLPLDEIDLGDEEEEEDDDD
ncbi:atypical membrane-integrating protein (Mistic protein) [Pseudalkalibacillus caeni]|uniref:atypical membrane-integrating protein (Mistic protein) n=1 Tax=Exobacillus caeni TaxID=2574798 RepID=UPI001484E07E|nr:atypical membrane-integrating protein (Mistic protein) [Pseudalkalibacillus caeni]